jgi:hypothetical protein
MDGSEIESLVGLPASCLPSHSQYVRVSMVELTNTGNRISHDAHARVACMA